MRKKTPKITIKPKYFLISCMVLCIVSMIVSFKYKDEIAPFKTTVGQAFMPMQKGINTIGKWLTRKADLINDMEKLVEENEAMKAEIEKLKDDNRVLIQDKYELDNLRELYELSETYEDYPTVAARVITKNPSSWYSTFTIDKGSKHGIKVDMNVIAPGGLVGLVCEVGTNYSIVRTIIDDKSNVTGMFKKSTLTCNVAGDLTLINDGYLRVTGIPKDAQISDGEIVTTSYDSPKFHAGIIIGYISNITVDSNNMTKSAYIKPVVDFSDLDTVLIITELNKGLY